MTLYAKIKTFYPILTAIILIAFSALPLNILSGPYTPMVDIIIIYFWVSFYPTAMKGWLAFMIGILRDILSGSAIGLNALVYLTTRQISLVNEDNKKASNNSFAFIWQKFAMVIFIATGFKWFLLSIVFDTHIPIFNLITSLGVSILVYPVFHIFFSMLLSLMPKEMLHVN